MNGVRRFVFSDEVAYVITRPKYFSSLGDDSGFYDSFELEIQFGDLLVYRHKDGKPMVDSNRGYSASNYRLDAIVKRIQEFGMRQPGTLADLPLSRP